MSLTASRELAVLTLLSAHPAHGYQIASAFENGPFKLLGLGRSAVYAILSRFVKRGWIVEVEEQSASYPDRRICHITDQGRKEIVSLTQTSGGFGLAPLLTLFMLKDSGHDVSQSLQKELDIRKAFLKQLDKADATHAQTFSHQLAIGIIQTELELLEKAIVHTNN